MPRATVLKTSERFDLTTIQVAEGEEVGWVELRRLPFGEKLRKDAEAMKMRFSMDKASEDLDAEIAMVSEFATLREFALCIVDHNLTDESNNKLNFTKVDHVRSLDPRVGDEISTLIGNMNDFERKSRTNKTDSSGK